MSIGLIALVTLIYIGVAISEAWSGRPGMAVVFVGYAFANLGLIWNIYAGT